MTTTTQPLTISSKGHQTTVPSLSLGVCRIMLKGNLLRVASIHDEEWIESKDLPKASDVVAALSAGSPQADLFTFSERPGVETPTYPYPLDYDNCAVIKLTDYDGWWDKLPQVGRRNVRTAEKKGLVVRETTFDDKLVEGISQIYNETKLRHGKPFWHYNKPIDKVREENATYLDRSIFLGAYFEDQLVGFIKMVLVDNVASIMQILSMVRHQDKRTTNALIAKAVRVAVDQKKQYLKYCRFVYGPDIESALTDFKRRNGFERINVPRYFVPLSAKGKLALQMRMQHGVKGLIPQSVYKLLIQARSRYYSMVHAGAAEE
jgi:hypothetical protein